MGWKETRVQEFATGERSRAENCRRYGVSRNTGYKWYEQFLLHRLAGLADRSRKHPHQLPLPRRATPRDSLSNPQRPLGA